MPQDNGKVFAVSPNAPKLLAAKNNYPTSSGRHLAVSPMKAKNKEDTIYTISMRSNSMESSSPVLQSRPKDQAYLTPRINHETRGIAALAAEKKRKQNPADPMRLGVSDSQFNKTFVSNYGDENDSRLTPSRLATHNLKYGSRYNLTDDSDSLITVDQRSRHTDPVYLRHRADNSPAKQTGKIPRATKYRPQPLLKANQHISGSQSERMSDKTSDTPSKVINY